MKFRHQEMQLSFSGGKVEALRGWDNEMRSFCVDRRHHNPKALIAHAAGQVKRMHPNLRKRLKWLMFPFEDGTENMSQEEVGRLQGLTKAATATRDENNDGAIVFWGKDHVSNNYDLMCLEVLEHEMAHALGDKNGSVPDSLKNEWEKARLADASHHAALERITPFVSMGKVKGFARLFHYEGEYLNSYVTSDPSPLHHEREDWAESVQSYLSNQRDGCLWSDGKSVFDFHKYYPNRSRIVQEWLKS